MACLSEDQLQLLASGSVAEADVVVLEAHCRGCDSCRARLEEARSQVALATKLMEAAPVLSPSPISASEFSVSPDSIPGYEILREIHRGGQGVVYQAIQKATKRRVAVKVMREGPFAGPQDRARFEREVQIMGALKHPHVVTIHDSGFASGSFYYSMDYISGKPLDDYIQEHDLGIRATLELFVKVCEAVNAAHLRGVIHRDLKPDNIRVDEVGEPHVLDFGMAKMALGQVKGESRPQLMTVTGQFVGSPPWASPEQAEGIPEKIDIRTDVYSFGVILYQVLTGTFPYEVTGNIWDVLERVRRAEPARPSTLRHQIDDEVETIILKCLAKERERRYQTAGELARDIRHYLAGEPIEAKRDSTIYVLRKALRRHRAAVGVIAGFIVLLSVSLVISVSLWYRAQQNFVDAERGRRDAEEARKLAASKARDAEAARSQAEASAQEARRRLYSRQMVLAQQALESNNSSLQDLLEASPPEFRDWEWYRLWRLRDRSLMTLQAQTQPRSVSFTPDSRQLVSICKDGQVRIWDAYSGETIRTLAAPKTIVSFAALSPDGTRLVLCSLDGTVEVRDLSDHRVVWSLQRPTEVVCVTYSPDGKQIASGGGNPGYEIQIVDAETGQELRVLQGHVGTVNRLAYSPNGRVLASGSLDSFVRLWDITTGMELYTLSGHQSRVYCIAFNTNGSRLASCGGDKVVRLWDTDSGRELLVLRGHSLAANAVAFSPDGLRVCAGGRDATLQLWDAETGTLNVALRGHTSSVDRVVFSPDGKRIASSSRDKTIRLWDPNISPEERTVRTDDDAYRVAFSPDGSKLAAPVGDSVTVFDFTTHMKLWVLREPGEKMRSVDYSPNGQYLAGSCVHGKLCVWDAGDGRRLWTAKPPSLSETSDVRLPFVRFSRDSRRIVSGAEAGSVYLWDAASAKKVLELHGHQGEVWCADFSPDGKRIATGSEDNTIKIWDLESGEELKTFTSDGVVDDLAYSPDGRQIASSSSEGRTAYVWDAETGRQVLSPLKHPAFVPSVAFNPDGTRIITVGVDVRLWDSITGELMAKFGGDLGLVFYYVVFSPDGQAIAAAAPGTSGSHGYIKIWEAADPDSVNIGEGG